MQKNKIILGTAQFGLDYGVNNISGKATQEQVFKILTFASENGILELDTAAAYGNALELLGAFNLRHPSLFNINTKFKVNHLPFDQHLLHSLDLLNTKVINVYFFHSFNDYLRYPELVEQLLELKNINKIRKIGLSVYSNLEFKAAIESNAIDVIQFPFNLLDNLNQRSEMIKLGKLKNKELQARSVFLQGLLFMDLNEIPIKLLPLKPYLQTVNEIATKTNLSVQQFALGYVLQEADIDKVIIGVDNLEQLKNNLKLAEHCISNSVIKEVNNINVIETELLYPYNW